MRTTLNLDDDILREAKSLSELQGKSLGSVISSLVRQGLQASRQGKKFPTFDVPADAKIMTVEMVKEALDEW